jgi:hypothetical protein
MGDWGPGVPRHRTSTSYWRGPIIWNKEATLTGDRPRVFCASCADVFDNEGDPSWRTDLWALIKATPNLHWMLLTKRIANAPKMLPPDWPYPHVGLMSTLENQDVFDRDWPKLARVPVAWRGVSMEPLLSAINIGAARPWRREPPQSPRHAGGVGARHPRPMRCGRYRFPFSSSGAEHGRSRTAARSMAASTKSTRLHTEENR